MLRALFFFLKVSLMAAAVIWLTLQPARWVTITGLGYEIQIQAAFLGFLVLLLLFVATRLDRLWRAVISVPHGYRRYRHAARRDKGYRTLTDGLVAIAAGDAQAAARLSQRAENLIPGTPLTKLLTAQTALLNGNAPRARREFADLLDDRSAAFLGVRGLLNETLAEGNYREALDLVRKAEALQPSRGWVIRTLFDLETRNREWLKAERTLKKAAKLGVFDADTAARHRQAIWTAMSADAEAHGETAAALKLAQSALSLDPGFTPAAARAARLANERGKRRAALKIIEIAWEKNPHPDLAALWMSWAPPSRKSKSIYDSGRDVLEWAKKLDARNPDHREGRRLIGNAALQVKLWREAREQLAQAMDYRALARLEREETGNEAKAREWLEMAADAAPDPRWICAACGHGAPEWQALCRHCGHFNSMSWMTPSLDVHEPVKRVANMSHGILEPPRHIS
jgi:HemY protein